MYSDAKRIHLIEKLLKVQDDGVLERVEEILDGAAFQSKNHRSIMDLAGSLTKQEGDEMQRVIDEAFGHVDKSQIKTPFE